MSERITKADKAVGPFKECGYFWVFWLDGGRLRAMRDKTPRELVQEWEEIDAENAPQLDNVYCGRTVPFDDKLLEIQSGPKEEDAWIHREYFDFKAARWLGAEQREEVLKQRYERADHQG